jgi:hypothetical protein
MVTVVVALKDFDEEPCLELFFFGSYFLAFVLFRAEIVLGTMEQDDGEGWRRHTQGLDDRSTLLGQLVEGGSPS